MSVSGCTCLQCVCACMSIYVGRGARSRPAGVVVYELLVVLFVVVDLEPARLAHKARTMRGGDGGPCNSALKVFSPCSTRTPRGPYPHSPASTLVLGQTWALMWCPCVSGSYIAQGLDREHACGACRGGVLAQYQEHFRAFRSLPSPNRSELEAIATSRSRVASSVTMKGRGSRTGSRRSGGQ
jgi:hypothetical protein